MTYEIEGIRTTLPGKIPALDIQPSGESASHESFSNLLMQAIDNVNSLNVESDLMAVDLALGKPVELHQVMLAASKAQIAMELFIQLRNKLIEAYQEISRMPI